MNGAFDLRGRWRVCLSAATITLASTIALPATALSTCPTDSAGLDASKANTLVVGFHGGGYGETFIARDTQLHSITVWRPADPALDALPRQLFIMTTDSTGRPQPTHLLLIGPQLIERDGDGVHPVKYEYAFEPPFTLPGQGVYFFTIQSECFSEITLLADTTDSFPDGKAWHTSGVFDCSVPGNPTAFKPLLDLVFKVEFCDTTTEARPTSWGQLKLKYR